MGMFLVDSNQVYFSVRDSKCLGMPCLRLGTRYIDNPLEFGIKNRVYPCCVTMIDKGCPGKDNKSIMFSVKERSKNISLGMRIRRI